MLSDERIAEMMRETWGAANIAPRHAETFARAIEAEVHKQDDALIRQLVEAMEPVAYVHVPHYTVEGKVRPVVSFEKYQQDYDDGIYSTRIPLYTAPQPAKATPTNVWQQAVDHALVSAHLGVAGEVTAEEATKILNDLICWNIQVATDPLTNGGKVLVSANAVAAINSPEATQHTHNTRNNT